MPCRDYDSQDEYERDQQKKLDAATKAACEALTELGAVEQHDYWPGAILQRLSKETQDWWKKHKAADAARKKNEREQREQLKKRENAKNKLTAEERELLGIK
jgi:hypothetical protein